MISLFFLCYFEVKTGEWHHAKGEHSFFKAHGGTTDLPDHHRFLYNVSLVKTVSKKEKKKKTRQFCQSQAVTLQSVSHTEAL